MERPGATPDGRRRRPRDLFLRLGQLRADDVRRARDHQDVNHVSDPSLPGASTTLNVFGAYEVQVLSHGPVATLVALGDSITGGAVSSPGGRSRRWTQTVTGLTCSRRGCLACRTVAPDLVHPNQAGYTAIANAFTLNVFYGDRDDDGPRSDDCRHDR